MYIHSAHAQPNYFVIRKAPTSSRTQIYTSEKLHAGDEDMNTSDQNNNKASHTISAT